MKARPSFQFFPANMIDGKSEHILKVGLLLETGVEVYAVLATDKTDIDGFVEMKDLAELLAKIASAVVGFDNQIKKEQFPGAEAEFVANLKQKYDA